MPDEPDEITTAGRKIVDLFGACAASPDDLEIGQAADAALMDLDQLLAAVNRADGDPPEPRSRQAQGTSG